MVAPDGATFGEFGCDKEGISLPFLYVYFTFRVFFSPYFPFFRRGRERPGAFALFYLLAVISCRSVCYEYSPTIRELSRNGFPQAKRQKGRKIIPSAPSL